MKRPRGAVYRAVRKAAHEAAYVVVHRAARKAAQEAVKEAAHTAALKAVTELAKGREWGMGKEARQWLAGEGRTRKRRRSKNPNRH